MLTIVLDIVAALKKNKNRASCTDLAEYANMKHTADEFTFTLS